MRILLVEDDATLGEGLRNGLRNLGFAVEWMRDGAAAQAALDGEPFAVVVLDLGLPKLGGMELLKSLRAKRNTTPVLVLTARDALDHKVDALDLGADDYVVKPVALAELAARLRALVRRSQGQAASDIQVGDIKLDPADRTVTYQGKPVALSNREFSVLHELMLHAGRVLTREQLEARLYEWGESIESNAIEVHVHHLRRKLASDVIATLRGVGYMMPKREARS